MCPDPHGSRHKTSPVACGNQARADRVRGVPRAATSPASCCSAARANAPAATRPARAAGERRRPEARVRPRRSASGSSARNTIRATRNPPHSPAGDTCVPAARYQSRPRLQTALNLPAGSSLPRTRRERPVLAPTQPLCSNGTRDLTLLQPPVRAPRDHSALFQRLTRSPPGVSGESPVPQRRVRTRRHTVDVSTMDDQGRGW